MVKKKILLAAVILVMAIFALFQVAAKDAETEGAGIGLLFLLALYFAPSLVACLRKKKNLVAIFALNLLLGWTVIGWIVALIWSLTAGGQQEQQEVKKRKKK